MGSTGGPARPAGSRRVARSLAPLVVASSLVLSLAACSGERDPAADQVASDPATTVAPTTTVSVPPPAALDWHACPVGEQTGECATLVVPLDYEHPTDGRTVDVAVSRIPAADQANRIGALVVNPGGPGGSGLGFAAQLLSQASREGGADQAMLERFDLIGFDPRGVGASSSVHCGDLDGVDRADFSPEDVAERDQLLQVTAAFAQACRAETGELVDFVGTSSAARDVDQLRRALGEDKLNLFGFSYGTLLFATYADLFPAEVRAAVLDGAEAPNLSGLELVEQQAKALESQLDDFFSTCVAEGCAFGHGDPAGAYNALMTAWDGRPLPADGGMLTASQATTAVATALFSPITRRLLETALAKAEQGDASLMGNLWDYYSEIDGGTRSNISEADVSINCLDFSWPTGDSGYAALATRVQVTAPRLGEAFLREFLPCTVWPVPPTPRELGTADGAPPIVVVGTTGDPSTPYEWAQRMADHLSSGVLLSRDGVGHTAWGASSCIDAAIRTYFLSVSPPADGTMCQSD